MISGCEAVLGKVFFVLEKLKNAGILTYVHIFLCTISEKQQAKTVFSLRSTAVIEAVIFICIAFLLLFFSATVYLDVLT